MRTQTKERTWFAGITDPDQLQDLYRGLAKAYHPDHGGDTATMQEINSQYDQARKQLEAPAPSRKYTAPKANSSTYTKTRGFPTAEAMQAAAFARCFCPGVEIEYQGAEVIARGATYENREKLKELGYWWSAEQRYWHFVKRPGTGRKGAV